LDEVATTTLLLASSRQLTANTSTLTATTTHQIRRQEDVKWRVPHTVTSNVTQQPIAKFTATICPITASFANKQKSNLVSSKSIPPSSNFFSDIIDTKVFLFAHRGCCSSRQMYRNYTVIYLRYERRSVTIGCFRLPKHLHCRCPREVTCTDQFMARSYFSRPRSMPVIDPAIRNKQFNYPDEAAFEFRWPG